MLIGYESYEEKMWYVTHMDRKKYDECWYMTGGDTVEDDRQWKIETDGW